MGMYVSSIEGRELKAMIRIEVHINEGKMVQHKDRDRWVLDKRTFLFDDYGAYFIIFLIMIYLPLKLWMIRL